MSFILQQTVLGGQGGLAGRSAQCTPGDLVPGEELALGTSSVSHGVLLKQLALPAGLVCMLLLFALLPLPWPLPTPTPTPFCLYSLSSHSLEPLAGAPVC